jgi:large subunit ribosomal protein L4
MKERDRNIELSARNIKGVKVLEVKRINVLDILKHKKLVVTESVVASIEGALG